MKIKQMMLLIFILILLTLHCDLTDLPVNTSFVLTLEDVSCTEAWIKVSGVTGSEIQLNRDGKEGQKFILSSSPQVIVDDSLLPNKNYTYQAIRTDNGETSSAISITTLDTTSHNWSWEITTLGGAASSALYDVAIINDTLAYAVGQIYINDSTGKPDPIRYNLAVWEGHNWSIRRAPYYYQGQSFYNPIQSVFTFSQKDILFCGNGIIHWDGELFNPLPIPSNVWGQYQMNKIWGTSSEDFFIVGNNGSIAHYINGAWQKLTSGTTLDVVDIWGSTNSATGQEEILAVASQLGSSFDRKILQLNRTTVNTLSDRPIAEPLSGVWFIPDRHYYVVGSGIYEKRSLSDSTWITHLLDLTPYYTGSVRGNAINDVLVVGSFGEVLHYNGITWQSQREETGLTNGAYGGLAVKGNLVIAVGQEGPEAVIAIGRR